MAAGDWSLGFSWLHPGLLHSSGKSVLVFQFKSVYEVLDARCVCAQVSILLLTAPEIISHNISFSVLKVTLLSSSVTF